MLYALLRGRCGLSFVVDLYTDERGCLRDVHFTLISMLFFLDKESFQDMPATNSTNLLGFISTWLFDQRPFSCRRSMSTLMLPQWVSLYRLCLHFLSFYYVWIISSLEWQMEQWPQNHRLSTLVQKILRSGNCEAVWQGVAESELQKSSEENWAAVTPFSTHCTHRDAGVLGFHSSLDMKTAAFTNVIITVTEKDPLCISNW